MAHYNNTEVRLHYYTYGNGPEVMLAFHGFGMKGTQFSVLEPAFSSRYTIYSFDLFFHGETEIKNSEIGIIRMGLSASAFSKHIAGFIKEMNFQKVSLLSYSMGALMALALIENMPHIIDKAYFIAPDGIRPNRLLQLGGRNFIMNRLFYKLVYSPSVVDWILNSMLRYRYIDQSLYRILQGEFGTEATRLTCYQAITYHSGLRFNKRKLAHIINKHQIRTSFYFGKTDRLFPPSVGKKFSAMLENSAFYEFDTGHELVNKELAEFISNQLAPVEYDSR